jgi:cellulose synthase/poly-beta-1,6-N-acetylglucosamine synthase-like glycosyltransferase
VTSFRFLFGTTLGLLVFTLVAGWALSGPAAWAVGLLYIAFDTWLLAHMVRASRRAVRDDLGNDPFALRGVAPRLSILIPARNERAILPACLAALEGQTMPGDEIVVIDDGSTDGTQAWLEKAYALRPPGLDGKRASAHPDWPGLKLLAKERSGKADSLNRTMRLAEGDVVVTLDADTLLEPRALEAVRAAFANDPALAAACGVLTPVCGPGLGRLFEFYQRFEYLRGFLWRLAWMRSEMLLLVSGAFAAYRKPVLDRLRGYDPKSLVEDYDLIYRLHRLSHEEGLNWKTRVIAAARADTDSPGRPRQFLQQRARWFAGFLETLFRNKDMVGNPRYGAVGRWMLPIKAIDCLLPVYALCAALLFFVLLAVHRNVPPIIVDVLAAKLLFDLGFHFWAMRLYYRWQRVPLTPGLWGRSLLATLTEPLAFQLLRHAGATLGWIAFLRGRIEWTPQRAAAEVAEVERAPLQKTENGICPRPGDLLRCHSR